MNSDRLDRLEASFSKLAARGPEMMDRFFAKLFAGHPEFRGLFPQDMTDPKNMVLMALVLIMQTIRHPEGLAGTLIEMGARHAGYGVKRGQFPIFRDALIAVMAEMSGPAWEPGLSEDWREAIDFVSAAMLEGAAKAPSAR